MINGRSAGRGPRHGDRVEVLGIPIDRLDLAEAVVRIAAWLPAAGATPPADTRLVFTPNPEILFAAASNPALAATLRGADLLLPDGIGVVWAARRLGRPVPERVTGIDLVQRLLAVAAGSGHRVFFLGTRPEVVAEAGRRAVVANPGLRLAGCHHGYFELSEEERVVAAVRASAPDLLFVGMGAPREQEWLSRHRGRLGAAVAVGVGGSLDVLGGAVRRAPGWVRRAHLEWLYRLAREPRRLPRMTALPRFVVAILRQGGRA